MSHLKSPRLRGEGESRPVAPWLKRAGVGLVAPALAALALGAAPAAAQAATTGTLNGSFTLPAGVAANPTDVHIRLVDRTGSVVSSVTQSDVTITPASGNTSASFTISSVPAGQYYVYFSDTVAGDNVQRDYYGDGGADNINKATLVTVPATGGTQTLSAVGLSAGAIITGSVSDPNAPAGTVERVYAEPVDANSVPDPVLASSLMGATVTSGSYTISGLPSQQSIVLFYDASGTNYALDGVYADNGGLTYDYGSASQYPLTTPSTTANIAVPVVGGLSGTVTDSSGTPLQGVDVLVYDAAGNIIPVSGTTAADGTYTVTDVLPGTYEVQFSGLSASNIASIFYGGSSLATGTKVTVSSNATTANINAALGTGATVSGTVTAAQGGAVLGGLPVEIVDVQGNVIAQTTTNVDGTYSFHDVPGGTWYLEFVGGRAYNGQYYATEYYLGQSTLGGSLAIKLTAGETLTNVNEALMSESTTLPGLPKVSVGRLSGLATNKVALSFRLTTGAGPAGYLLGFSIKLPKYVSWNKAALKKDIVIPRDKYTYSIKAGRLVVLFTSGKKVVNFRIKAGGLKVGKGLQAQAKARKIASEGIALIVTDTTGKLSSASYTVKKPH